jgi:hypothetical protein
MSSTMPWDRWTPSEEPEPAELPYVPPPAPAPVPAPVSPPHPRLPARAPGPELDLGGTLSDALEAAWPVIKDQVIGYARSVGREIRAGETVDLAHPRVTVQDLSGRELVVADARNRSWRTFLQGLAFDVFAGIVAAVATLSGADPFVRETWLAFGVLILKTFVSAGISYAMRMKAAPTIRTKGEELALMPLPRPVIEDDDNRRSNP